MSHRVDIPEATEWKCNKCAVSLEMRKVEVAYRGCKYPVELPQCPVCGIVFISEQLAVGRMAQIEKLLEDK
jgi:NAD-dependent SIR2 family protein deacetylase